MNNLWVGISYEAPADDVDRGPVAAVYGPFASHEDAKTYLEAEVGRCTDTCCTDYIELSLPVEKVEVEVPATTLHGQFLQTSKAALDQRIIVSASLFQEALDLAKTSKRV